MCSCQGWQHALPLALIDAQHELNCQMPCHVLPEQDLMRRNLLFEDSMRWARCLCEVLAAASTLCPDSARAAYAEIVNRLQVLLCAK